MGKIEPVETGKSREQQQELQKIKQEVEATVAKEDKEFNLQKDKAKSDIIIYSEEDLISMELPEPKWAVPGIIPEGLTLLCGKPKIGKSFLVLDLAYAVATGGLALGQIQVEQGSVLYLTLEDSWKRIQKRIKTVRMKNKSPTQKLNFAVNWPRIDDGGAEALLSWIDKNQDTRLVIIDTLEKIRSRKNRVSKKMYELDYQTIEEIKKIADATNISLIVVHHANKSESDDFMDLVSGSTGLTGAADGIAMLMRKSRAQSDAVLSLSGKDIDDLELALSFDKQNFRWKLLGDAQFYSLTPERTEILKLLQKSDKPMGPKDVAQNLDKSEGAVRKMLSEMANENIIDKKGRGKYCYSGNPLNI